MRLKVLIVGRGDGANAKVGPGHVLEFVKCAWDLRSESAKGTLGDYLGIEDYHFVIQHLSPGNPEGPGAIVHWKSKGREHHLLGVCGGASADLQRAYAATGVPCIENCGGRDGVLDLAWHLVSCDFAGNAKELYGLLISSQLACEVLPSLSILCQGYLAVHCGPESASGEFTVDDVVGSSVTAVEEALHNMNWGDVLKSAGGLVPALTSSDQMQRRQLQRSASEASFWAVFDQTEPEGLVDAAKKEWKRVSGGGDLGKKVVDLINALPLKPGTSAHDDFAKLVAEAYIELAKALGSVK